MEEGCSNISQYWTYILSIRSEICPLEVSLCPVGGLG